MSLWLTVAAASVGCAALKQAGYIVPAGILDRSAVRRVVETLPVALLSALVAVSTFASGQHLVLDSRAAGFATAIVLLALRMPFLVVVVAACAVAAAVHAV